MAVEEPEKIISDMCDKLYARGYVKENFKEGVLKRERLSPTSFFHGFAIPHNMLSLIHILSQYPAHVPLVVSSVSNQDFSP